MEDFHFYSPEDVIYLNLQETAKHMNMVCEQEMAHLRELASETVKDIENITDFTSSIPDLVPNNFSGPLTALFENTEYLVHFCKIRTVWQTVLLCMEIHKQLNEKKPFEFEAFLGEPDEIDVNAFERIAYQRSSYADSAYLRFAECLNLPRAFYTQSFPAACEEVYNGLCEYCILPLENSSEGQLNSFSRLIDRYALKIAATCDIIATDKSRTTRFALLRRHPVPLNVPDSPAKYFEFTLPITSDASYASVLTAAELCGLEFHRSDSRLQQNSDKNRMLIHFVFNTEKGNLPAFLLYLAIKTPQAEIVGIYPLL